MKLNNLCINFTIGTLFLMLAACNNNDQAQDKNNHINENDTISSLQTDLNSELYPHTQPVKIQDAKYEFETIENDQNMQLQIPQSQQDNRQGQTPSNAQQPSQAEAPQNANQNQGGSEFVTSVIELTNAERQKNGLPALKAYPDLSNVANVKAQDMNEKGYFSHTSPTYGSPFDMMRDFGITYQSAGENIAQGQRTPEEVVNAWMNSQGHRANILNNKFTHIGVGFEEAGYEWVQMFVKK
ncbi:CAP domain-containing protein [Bacillus sp. 03113]|uniref:CAP domain-containing protein n=1 Tax=Bacillus sp. 03113 TaxID=2578211 RepID=UPI001142B52B|nr:CAP domain-containing protein [Bacillus sp. 03113]